MVFRSIINFFRRKQSKIEIKKEVNLSRVVKEKESLEKPVEETIKEVKERKRIETEGRAEEKRKEVLDEEREKIEEEIVEEIQTIEKEEIKEEIDKEILKKKELGKKKIKIHKDKKEIPRVIALANQKGGVGKSTTAINMSASMAKLGKKVILIDIDPQANTTSGVGINKYNVNRTIYDAMIERADINELIQETNIDGLFIVPSNIHLAGAEVELVNMMMREQRLKKIIEPIRDKYDFIIIDCPPALSVLTINALVAADEVLIPIQCEYYALEGLGQLLRTIELVKNNLNSNLEISGFVMTMYDSRTKLSGQVVDEVRRYFGEKVYKTIIPRNVRVSEAPSYGLPVILYDPDCKGAIAYINFTKEVINYGEKRTWKGT